jgi:spore coat protein U-like protein
MKHSMRLLAAAAFVAAPALVHAQAITGSIAASAVIGTVFSFGTAAPLDFGSVTPGTTATASGSIPLSRNVGVIYTLPDGANTGRLTGPGAATLMPAYTCGVGSTNAAIVTVFAACAPLVGTTAVLTLKAPVGTATEYVIFNGSLTAAQTNTTPGAYTGTIRITATPN